MQVIRLHVVKIQRNIDYNILNNRAGGVTVLWLVAWIFLVYESPREHSRITQEELNYIEGYLVGTGAVGREVSQLRVFSPNRDGQTLLHLSHVTFSYNMP